MKNVITALMLIVLFPSLAMAKDQAHSATVGDNFSGFYLGAGIGVTQGIFRGTESTFYTGTGGGIGNLFDNNRFTLYDTSPTGRLRLGYGWQGHRWYFGLYTEGDFYSLSRHGQKILFDPRSSQFINFSTAARLTSSLSFGIKPGVLFSPQTLLFAQMGGSYARLHLNTNNTSTATASFAAGTVATQTARNAVGFQAGLGMEQKVSARLSLWLDYLYNYYGHITHRQTNQNAVETVNTSYGNYMVLLGINYYVNHSSISTYQDNTLFPSGFYVAAFGGYQQIGTNQNLEETIDSAFLPSSILGYYHTFKLANQNAVGGVQLGYQMVHRDVVIDVSADSTLGIKYKSPRLLSEEITNPLPVQGTFHRLQTSIIQRDYFGVNIDPGYLISSHTSLFARFGIVDSQFALVAKTFFAATQPNVNDTFDHKIDWVGYRVGLGMRQQLTSHLTLSLVDQYTFYPTIHFINQLSTAAVLRNTLQLQAKPHNNQVLLGIQYYFSATG